MTRLRRAVAAIAMAIICAAACAAAERGETVLFYDSGRAGKLIELNPHVLAGATTLVVNYESAVPGVTDLMLSPGLQLGVGIDVRFNLRNSFGLATGLEVVTNQSGYAMSIVTGSKGAISTLYTRNRYCYANVPVYVSWRFNIGRRMTWNTDLGAFISHGIGGNMRTSGYTAGENDMGQPVVTHVTHKSDYYDGEQPLINGVKQLDYGPRLSTGLIYKHRYSFNAVFQMSLPNQAINHGVLDVGYRHLSVAFQLGYVF